MGHDILQVIGVNCVQNIKEEITIRHFLFGKLIVKEDIEFDICFEIRPESFDRELLEMRHTDVVDLFLLEDLLPICKYILEETKADLFDTGKIILHCYNFRLESGITYNAYLNRHNSLLCCGAYLISLQQGDLRVVA